MPRCPDCSKFVSQEQAEPELNIEVELTNAEGEKPGDASVTGDVRLVLQCADCGTELMESTPSFEKLVPLDHHESDDHDVELTDESATETDFYDGKPGTPARYRRHFYGAEVTGTVKCSCGAEAEFSETVSEQAGAFESMV